MESQAPRILTAVQKIVDSSEPLPETSMVLSHAALRTNEFPTLGIERRPARPMAIVSAPIGIAELASCGDRLRGGIREHLAP